MKDIRFSDQVAIVTGAGNGLGKAYAMELAWRGAKVVVNDLSVDHTGKSSGEHFADAVVEEIKQAGGIAIADRHSVLEGEAIAKTALDRFGRVDILINNAGILRDRSFGKMTNDEWTSVIDTHLNGTFHVTRAVWPQMRDQHYGRIINTSSGAGIYGNFGQANYSAAKLAIHGFTQALAIEGAAKGITVNTIAPVAATRMFETIASKEMMDSMPPEFVVPLVIRLCAQHNEETGSLFEVGGGWMAKLRWERAVGATFPSDKALSAEAVDKAWDRITDFTDADHPANVVEAGKRIRAHLELASSD